MSQGYTKGVPIDTDNTLSLDSDLLVPSQKAIKFYVDSRTGSSLRWDVIYDPVANQSMDMGAYTTVFNWQTGTSTNNLFSLTTDASANGTGALLNLATGASSTVLPLLVKAGATTALTVNASAQVLVGTLTSGRITYAGTNGLLQDSSNMTFDGNRISLATTGNTGGLLIGGDANLYRSAADTLRTDDSFVVGTNLSVLNAGTFSLYESGSVNFSSFVAGTQAADLRYTLPTSQPTTNQVLTATSVTGAGPYDIALGWSTPSGGTTIGASVSGGTAGSVLFVGSGPVLAQDNANFYWDDTNNTFGIGTTRTGAISGTNPSVRILGTGTSSATSSFEVQDSGTNTILFVRNDGRVAIGTNSPSNDLSFGGESARTIALERRTTGSGNNLTIQAGGAQLGASGANGGNLILSSGISTGGGSSVVDIRVSDGLSFGTSDNTPATALYLTGTGSSFYTTTGTHFLTFGVPTGVLASDPFTFTMGMVATTLSAGHILSIYAGSTSGGTDDDGGHLNLYAGDSTGSGSSSISFYTATAGGSGTTVRTSSLKMTLTGAGQLQVSTTGSAAGILLGGDAQLYRSAADVLRTPDSLTVDASLTVGTLTSTRVTYAGTGGLLQDSANMTFDGNQLALATTGSSGGILIGADAQLYRSAVNTLRTPDSLVVDVNLTVSGTTSVGAVGGTTGTINLLGSTSGTVSVLAQAAAGTYNFNLPTTAGSSGHVLTSGGGGATAMTWTDPASLAVRWNSIANPNGNQSLTMSTHTTTWNWATGTSTNNLFNLTTDASANGTGALLRVATGTSSTVVPLLVVAAGTTALTVNASAQVLVNSLTSGRVTYAGTNGLLQDSSNMTFDGNQLSLVAAGSSGGLLIGSDVQIYRASANTMSLAASDSLEIPSGNLGVGQTAPGSGSRVGITYNATVGSGTERAILYTGTVSAAHTGFYNIVQSEGSTTHSTGTVNWISGALNRVRAQSTGGTVSVIYGLHNLAWMDSASGTPTYTTNIGVYAEAVWSNASFTGTATVGSNIGLQVSNSHAVISGGGTVSISSEYGLLVSASTATGITVSNRYAVRINDPGGSGTLTTQYGLYLEDLDRASTNYGIYFAGTSGAARQGIWWNGDVNLYRSAADVLATDDHFNLATSNREVRFTTSSFSAGGVLFNSNMRFTAHATGGFSFLPQNAYTHTSSSNQVVYLAAAFSPSSASAGSLYGVNNLVTYDDGSTTGNFTGEIIGSNNVTTLSTYQSGSHTYNRGIAVRGYLSVYDDNGGTGAITTNAYGGWFEVNDETSSARITNAYGLYSLLNAPYSQNNQTRYGLYVDSMPNPGAFTGTTTAAIRLAGTGGARDGILFSSDTNLYRSAADTLKTDDSFVVSGTASIGAVGGTTGTINLLGSTSGTVSVLVQAAAGTYNFNLPTTAGSSGYVLTSGGGGATAMTWTDPASLAVRWNSIANPNGNQSLTMSTHTTTWNWATGTSTNNLFNLTTDASANGTGALLRIATGTSSTVVPMLVLAAGTTALTVNASAQVLVGTLTSSRITYAGTNGLLQDSANMTFDGNRISLATTGNTGGLLIGGDANLYRSAADVLKTDDSFVVGASLSVLNAGTFSLYESGSVNFSSFAAGTQAADLRYTLPTSQPSTNQVLTASSISGTGPYDITLTWAAPSATISIGSGITSGTEGSVLFVGSGAVLAQDNSNFFWDDTNNYLGLGTAATPAARLHIAGNQTAAAWTTSGVLLRIGTATLTDSSSTGTVAASVANAIQTPTFAASSSTTYTDAATLYIAANPTAGTNVTITNGYALWVDSGATRLDGNLIVGTLTSTRIPYASTGGLLVDSASMTFDGSRIALSTTGSSGGLLIGGDANLYRSSANVLSTDDSFTAGGSISAGTNIIAQNGYISTGVGGGGFLGEIRLLGDTSGTVTILPQSSAGTYNFNLPTTAGSAGEVLTSGGGGGSPMTWTAPGALAVRWNSLANPTGNQSLTMSTHTTTWNWATGTSTNNLFNLTTDASANGTGALLRVATGTSSTVVPMLIVAAGTTALTVNASAQVLVNSLTSGRVTFAGTSGLLTDSSSFTYTTGTGQLALATTGSGAGLLLGGDAQIYRDSADVLRTPDSMRIDTALGINTAAPATTAGRLSVVGTSTDLSANFYNISSNATHTVNTPDTTTGRVWGLNFAVTAAGSGTFSDTSGPTGVEGLSTYSGSGTAQGATGMIAYARNTGTGTLVRASGLTIPSATNTGGGAITNLRSVDVNWNLTFTANNQSRIGIRIGVGPTNAGSFSGSVVGGIQFNSDSGGAQDGIVWGTTGDTNLYRSAANTLRTDDALIVTGNLTVSTLTSGRVPFASTSGLLVDSSAFTYTTGTGQLALTTTGSGGGIMLGGDAQWYRGSADRLETTDEIYLNSSTRGMGLGTGPSSLNAINAYRLMSTDVSTRVINGALEITGATSTSFPYGIQGSCTINATTNAVGWAGGLYGTCRDNSSQSGTIGRQFGFGCDAWKSGTGNVTTLQGFTGTVSVRSTATGTITTLTGLDAGTDEQSGSAAAVTNFRGIFSNTNKGGGGNWTNYYGVDIGGDMTGGTGTITSWHGMRISQFTSTGPTITTQYGLRIGEISKGSTNYAIYLDGTSGLARQGIWWNGDTNLYRSAADTLKTDDAFVTASTITGASSLTLGAAGGTTGSVLLKGTTSGTVTVTVASAAGTWSMTLPTSGGTSGYVLKTDGAGTTSWGNPGIAWTEVTGTSQSASAHAGYLANNAALVTITLPTPAVGSVIEIVGVGAGGWRAQCASGHTIRMGTTVSASTGYAQSTNQYDCIKIIGISATAWLISSAVGTIDIT